MTKYKFYFFLFLLGALLVNPSIVLAQGNDYMWQAAIAKTSFMTNISVDKESGRIVAGWTEIGGKLYELNVRIMGEELLRENVKARVRERLPSGQGWGAPQVNIELTQATEAAIYDRARALYDNGLN